MVLVSLNIFEKMLLNQTLQNILKLRQGMYITYDWFYGNFTYKEPRTILRMYKKRVKTS